MKFELTILGVNAAVPTLDRDPSAQVLNINDQLYLIDCGEGTQLRLLEQKIKTSKIDQVFISHLHGDHFFGLFGLISSFGLAGRERPLDIYSPFGLAEIFEAVTKHTGGIQPFPLNFHPVDTEKPQFLFENQHVKVSSIPLVHRVPTTGFLFQEKERLRSILPEKIQEYNIPYAKIPAIKAGADLTLENGTIIKNEVLTSPPLPPKSFAYCSDTRYHEPIIPLIENVDLLYHESTFCENKKDRTFQTGHSTAKEAATIAKKANAKKLILGHYSTRYKDLNCFLEEASTVFPNTYLGIQGETYTTD